jgi:hypothetical protein
LKAADCAVDIFGGVIGSQKDLPIPLRRLVKFIPKLAFISGIGSAS